MKIQTIALLLGAILLAGCGGGGSTTETGTIGQDPEKNNTDTKIGVITEYPASPDRASPIVPSPSFDNWDIGINALNRSTGQLFRGAKFGLISDAVNDKSYSLKSFGALGWNAVDIAFSDTQGNGSYTTLFLPKNSTDRYEWHFQVRCSQTDANISLTRQPLQSLNPYTDQFGRKRFNRYYVKEDTLIKRMKLVDLDTGTEVPILSPDKEIYRFNMNGSTSRKFKWVLQETDVDISTKTVRNLRKGAVQIKGKPAKVISFDDFTTPPTAGDGK